MGRRKTAVLSGILIGIGVIANTSMENRYIGAFLFSVALLTIIHCELFLYTGKIGFCIDNRHVFHVYDYIVMILLNFLGSGIVLLWLSCQTDETVQKFKTAAQTKFSHSYGYLFICGVLCGILMFVAVHCKNQLITVLCIMTFILCGFEHCIADFPSLCLNGFSLSSIVKFLLVILGNSVGGIGARLFTFPLKQPDKQ